MGEVRAERAAGERVTEVGRAPIGSTAATRYATLIDARGVRLSVRECWEKPGELWLTGINNRNDYRPVRLDAAQARALRDALDLYLEDRAAAGAGGG